MVNVSNVNQREATSSSKCEEAFSSASKLAEELKQSVDVLFLDQDVCRSHYTGNQSHCKGRREEQACPQGEADYNDFQPLSLD